MLKNRIHPGEFLREELAARGVSQTQLAAHIGMSPRRHQSDLQRPPRHFTRHGQKTRRRSGNQPGAMDEPSSQLRPEPRRPTRVWATEGLSKPFMVQARLEWTHQSCGNATQQGITAFEVTPKARAAPAVESGAIMTELHMILFAFRKRTV